MKRIVLSLSCLVACLAAEAAPEVDSLAAVRTLDIENIVVTGTRNGTDVRHLPMTVTTVGRAKIERDMQPSLLPLLSEQVPGLFVTSRALMGYGVSGGAAGAMSIRGVSGSAARMMVLVDGHPQYMGLWGHPVADACQSFLAERVEVLRGPASVLYGSNAMGGVINIVTRRMREDGVRTHVDAGYGSYNTLRTEATNRIRKGGFTSVVSASYNRTDGHRADMDFQQYGGYAKLGYEFHAPWSIRADVNVTHFDASNPGEASNPLADAEQGVTRGAASLSLENDYQNTSGALSLFYNWGRHKVNDGYTVDADDSNNPKQYIFNSRDMMAGASLYQSTRLFEGNRLTAGIDYFCFGGEAWNAFFAGERKGSRTDIADKTEHEVAGYVDFRQDLWRRLTLDAGIRVDYRSHGGTEWIPQFGASLRLPHELELKVTVAKGFRFPSIREMYMFPPQNPDLEPESMWNYEAAVSQRLLDGRLSWGLNLFFIDGKNMIVTVPREGATPLNMNTGAIRNAGAEASVAWRIAPAWSLDANYSFLYMKYPVIAAPEHKLYVGADFVRGRWTASTGVQYVAGLYTAVGTNPKTEDFVLWNARVSFRAVRWLRLWLRGDNLLAWRYEINAGYPMPRATVMGGASLDF